MSNKDLVGALENLLEEAKSGKLVALQFVGFDNSGNYTTSCFSCNLTQLSLAAALSQNLVQRRLDVDSTLSVPGRIKRVN